MTKANFDSLPPLRAVVRPTPGQVAADKAAIDAALLRLFAKRKPGLPAADPRPEKGPFAHLRAALKVLPGEELATTFPAWRGGWLDRIARNDRPALGTVDRKWAGMSAAEKAILAGGTAVIVNAKGELLFLSPAGPGAAVFCVGKTELIPLGGSVLDFTQREVGALLGEKRPKVRLDAQAGAKAMAAARRALEALRRTQTPASSVDADLVAGVCVEGFRDSESLVAVMKAARDAELECYFGFGDGENASDLTLTQHPWLVGQSVARVRGQASQNDSAKASVAVRSLPKDAAVRAIAARVAALSATSGLSISKAGLFLVARGGLARASLLRSSRVLATTDGFIAVARRTLASECQLVASFDD